VRKRRKRTAKKDKKNEREEEMAGIGTNPIPAFLLITFFLSPFASFAYLCVFCVLAFLIPEFLTS
jgi:hypothetical protein